MKALITGMNGTVAPALALALKTAGHSVEAWNRSLAPVDNYDSVAAFIRQSRPDCFFHVATGSADWAEWVADACARHDIPFLFTGSVSVFSASQKGPFTVDSMPAPDDDYGLYKLECE